MVELFVNGTLMRGLPLHPNLDGADFIGEFRTEPRYRLHSIADSHPGMYEVDHDGHAIHGELYRMSDDIWERVAAGEPPGLYKGTVHLHDHGTTDGVLCDPALAKEHPDISHHGGWRAYLASQQRP